MRLTAGRRKNVPSLLPQAGLSGSRLPGTGITSLVRPGHLTLMQLLEKMTVNPADLYHLPAGRIEKGAAADLVVFDPEEHWVPEQYASKSSNSPFTGWDLYGKVKMTVCNGNIVYQD